MGEEGGKGGGGGGGGKRGKKRVQIMIYNLIFDSFILTSPEVPRAKTTAFFLVCWGEEREKERSLRWPTPSAHHPLSKKQKKEEKSLYYSSHGLDASGYNA